MSARRPTSGWRPETVHDVDLLIVSSGHAFFTMGWR